MQTTQPFRTCHLQILRSLYGCLDVDAAHRCHGDGQLWDGGGDDDGARKNNDENRQGSKDRSEKEGDRIDGVDADNANAREGPVGNEIWGLVELFLKRRVEYRPHKERQIHWAKVNAEAQSRLDRLVTISSLEEETKLPLIRSSALTPRTPLFSMSGRGGSTTPNTSLTPLSSNRKLSQNEREMVSTIPSWNFISQMLQRRSSLCTESCQSFRSQPFLAQLLDEAEMRCKILERVLERLKMETGKQNRNIKKREGSFAIDLNPVWKRQKLEPSGTKLSVPSSLGHFFSNDLLESNIDDEIRRKDDSMMETQMKLCLWSSLLSSVKEIVNGDEDVAL